MSNKYLVALQSTDNNRFLPLIGETLTGKRDADSIDSVVTDNTDLKVLSDEYLAQLHEPRDMLVVRDIRGMKTSQIKQVFQHDNDLIRDSSNSRTTNYSFLYLSPAAHRLAGQIKKKIKDSAILRPTSVNKVVQLNPANPSFDEDLADFCKHFDLAVRLKKSRGIQKEILKADLMFHQGHFAEATEKYREILETAGKLNEDEQIKLIFRMIESMYSEGRSKDKETQLELVKALIAYPEETMRFLQTYQYVFNSWDPRGKDYDEAILEGITGISRGEDIADELSTKKVGNRGADFWIRAVELALEQPSSVEYASDIAALFAEKKGFDLTDGASFPLRPRKTQHQSRAYEYTW